MLMKEKVQHTPHEQKNAILTIRISLVVIFLPNYFTTRNYEYPLEYHLNIFMLFLISLISVSFQEAVLVTMAALDRQIKAKGVR